MIFGNFQFGQFLRHASFYADGSSDDDYWKLVYLFSSRNGSERHYDRLLGWVNHRISACYYTHPKESEIDGRVPVLLYGDSWAECLTPSAQCFDGILNSDPRFRKRFYMINFGISAYGVDQIFLLYQATVDRFQNPIVIFSFLDDDLDRSVLHLRDFGPKPFFNVKGTSLELNGTPVEEDLSRFFDQHPVQIWSYLYRMASFCVKSPLPGWLKAFMRGDREKVKKKKEVARAILLSAEHDLRKRGLRHLFLVFEETFKAWQPPGDFLNGVGRETARWHKPFLEDLFADRGIPHMWATKVIEQNTEKLSYDWQKFTLNPRNNHPNYLYNRLVAEQLLHRILAETAAGNNSSTARQTSD